MKEVSPKFTRVPIRLFRNLLFGFTIALILNACIMPVNISTLLNDEMVQKIVSGGANEPGVIVGIDPPDIEDLVPEFESDIGAWTETGGIFTLTFSALAFTTSPYSVTIKVTNYDIYDAGSIIWYCNNATPLTASLPLGEELEVSAASPFYVPGISRYVVTVIGEVDGLPYSTWFNMIIN